MSGESRALVHLSATALEALDVPPPAVADAIAEALRAVAAGRAWTTPKSSIAPGPGRLYMSMLAASESPPCAVVKAVGLNAANGARGLPHLGSTVTLMDGESGLPLAVMDGGWLTGVRTAALSALAARYLARQDSGCLLFVGCGLQARRHLAALAAEHPVRTVHAVSRTMDGARAFARFAGERFGVEAHAHADAGECLGEADVIVTTVPAADGLKPFLDPARVRPGAFVAACDLGRSWHPGLGGFDLVAVDDRAQEAALDHPLLPAEQMHTDLGSQVTGAHPGRTDPAQRTAFVFRGLGIADLAAAWLAWCHSRDAGSGDVLAC